MRKKKKVPTESNERMCINPFQSINFSKINRLGPIAQSDNKVKVPEAILKKNKNLGRADIRKEKSGRGGKEVTVIKGLRGHKKDWLKALQKKCGVGGTVKDEIIEIQGDKRDVVKRLLEKEGYHVVFSGGC